MGFGRLLSRRSKEPNTGYTASINSDFSIPESVPPAYPVDGRSNKSTVAIDAKPYMPAFPIMASYNLADGPKSRFPSMLSRKPVGQPEQQQHSGALPYQMAQAAIPRPPFSPGGSDNDGPRSFYSHQDDSGYGQAAYQSPPNIRPMSIPVPGITSNSNSNGATTKQRHTSGGFLSSFTNNTSSSSASNNNSSSSASSRPQVDVAPSEVRRCTKLLRRMYELQLDMWSMRYAYEQDMPERHEKRRQADALLVEIQNMIQTWTTTSGAGWSAEERAQVEYIGRHLDSLSQNKFW
ncbi:hypothetical protein CONLIGDRAFT_440819 [Coniochaeta ligniaria NRRL 30616]|uniref:Uncharacterized protein n=1 Tax=Coniochaeta ligniaria NRRL 30616 TaxID=1408157 RepID=A0A1J7J2P9_9PEZI|nr:hypothetical protein CONLIGDRAFT_440819 [Coniochaeta ligniaria NRRL 30616]